MSCRAFTPGFLLRFFLSFVPETALLVAFLAALVARTALGRPGNVACVACEVPARALRAVCFVRAISASKTRWRILPN